MHLIAIIFRDIREAGGVGVPMKDGTDVFSERPDPNALKVHPLCVSDLLSSFSFDLLYLIFFVHGVLEALFFISVRKCLFVFLYALQSSRPMVSYLCIF